MNIYRSYGKNKTGLSLFLDHPASVSRRDSAHYHQATTSLLWLLLNWWREWSITLDRQ